LKNESIQENEEIASGKGSDSIVPIVGCEIKKKIG
jgi:hypothetical protein